MALIKRGEIWHVRRMVGGVMIAKSTKTTNKRLAEQLEAKWASEVHSEVVVAGRKPITVEKAIAEFLNSRRGQAGHSSAEIKLRPFQTLNTKMVHEVTQAELLEVAHDMMEEGYAVNTINVSLVYWNAVQNYCTTAGYTPGKKTKKLKGGGVKVRFLTNEEQAALLDALDPKQPWFREKRKAQDNYDFVTMLLHTGAREQEIGGMQLSQIDQAAGTVTVIRSKGGNDTTLTMSRAVTEVIARRMVAAEAEPDRGATGLHGRVGNGYLFPERAGARYNNEWFIRACKRAKLKDVTLHTLRHTFATRMLKASLSLNEVQHLLGHKNISSTMVYAHLVPNLTANRAAEVLNQ